MLSLALIGLAIGSFGALLVGWSLVVARGLYLARHLSTLYIFENKDTSLFLTSTLSLHQLVIRNSLTHYCYWAFIDLTLAVEYDISKLLNIFDDVKFIRNRRKKGI